MPSIRQLCCDFGVSKSTALAAYARLESDGVIYARSRSGYYVATQVAMGAVEVQSPPAFETLSEPSLVSVDQVLVDIMEHGAAFDILPQSLGDEPDNAVLTRCLARGIRRQGGREQHYYNEPMGALSLRTLLAQRIGQGGGHIEPEQVLLTAGCQQSLLLALMASTEPGDIVAVESPGYYGVFQLLQCLGLKVLEIPSSEQQGISPESLEFAAQHWPIRALVVSPCFATPTGACMPYAHKVQLLNIAEKHQFTVIEDDIYGELHFSTQRPRTLLSFDSDARVILCASFSKCLSRDLRLGWIATKGPMNALKQRKLVTTLSLSAALQRGVEFFLAEGGFDRHLRQRRQQYHRQSVELMQLIQQFFPAQVAHSNALGGLSLWLKLPAPIDTFELYLKARKENILFAPGRLFSSEKRYEHCFRLGFAHAWHTQRRQALKRLGALIHQQI